MGILENINNLFKKEKAKPVPITCAFEVSVGKVTYRAQSADLTECKKTVLEVIPQIKTAPIDYIA